MRLDRSISLGLVQPLQNTWRRLRPSASKPTLPILMYHSISDTPESDVSEYYQVCTSPHRFAEQMAWLASRGWHGVTLSQALAHLNSPSSIKALNRSKLFAITFDDGFRDFATIACPILQQHGFSATMYLPTAFIGDQRRSFKDRECLTWSEVRELHRAGFEFGSHTVHHPKLVECSWPTIEAELADSKSTIEQALGCPATAFGHPYAYPQGNISYVRELTALLGKTGYTSCTTTIVGRARVGGDRLALPRLPANSADDPVLLEAKLSGAYDWMALPQLLKKRTAARFRSSAFAPVVV